MEYQSGHYYMMAAFGHCYPVFPSELCTPAYPSNFYLTDQGLRINISSDLMSATSKPSDQCQCQPVIQQNLPEARQKLPSTNSLRPLAPSPNSKVGAPLIASELHYNRLAATNVTPVISDLVESLPHVGFASSRLPAGRCANGRIPCSSCPKTFLRAQHLTRHMRIRKNKQPYFA
jgi:hypothetical protein